MVYDFRGLILKAAVLTVGMVMVGSVAFEARATTVLHEGSILGPLTIGGVGFSSLHKSSNGAGAGAGRGALSGDISYNWTIVPGTGPTIFTTGSTAVFNVADHKVYEKTYNTDRFELTLLNSASSVLTVGAEQTPAINLGGRTVAHSIGGSLDFRLDHFDVGSGSLVASATDTFFFDNAIMMSVVNGIAEINAGAIEIFLWGDTGSQSAQDSNFDCAFGNCSTITGKYYDAHGLGIDIAFTGAVVPLPAALPFLVTGLAGLALAARRRKTSAVA